MKCKLNTEDLSTGMYVAELDRPWVDSPFLFQGFTISSRRELAQLREFCEYVYVDVENSREDLRSRVRRAAVLDRGTSGAGGAPQPPAEQRYRSFKRELARALDIREKSRQYLAVLLEDAKLGKSVSIESVRTVTAELLDTLLINPTASLWLTRLQNEDERTAMHSVNVAVVAMVFARHLGMDRTGIETVGMGGLLHDIGKTRVPASVLDKEGPLDEEEWRLMRAHPEEGARLLEQSGGAPQEVIEIVRQHHERHDGSGYPQGLAGHQVAPNALLVGMVDAYDAMTADWPNAPAVSLHHALVELHKDSERLFGKELVERFVQCLGIYPVGTTLRLSNGATGIVISHNRSNRLRPVLLMVADARGQPYRRRSILNLADDRPETRDLEIREVVSPREFGQERIRKITAAESML